MPFMVRTVREKLASAPGRPAIGSRPRLTSTTSPGTRHNSGPVRGSNASAPLSTGTISAPGRAVRICPCASGIRADHRRVPSPSSYAMTRDPSSASAPADSTNTGSRSTTTRSVRSNGTFHSTRTPAARQRAEPPSTATHNRAIETHKSPPRRRRAGSRGSDPGSPSSMTVMETPSPAHRGSGTVRSARISAEGGSQPTPATGWAAAPARHPCRRRSCRRRFRPRSGGYRRSAVCEW
jgi:hypothetical protein